MGVLIVFVWVYEWTTWFIGFINWRPNAGFTSNFTVIHTARQGAQSALTLLAICYSLVRTALLIVMVMNILLP